MKDVFKELLVEIEKGKPTALATLIESKGPVPMSHSAKMLLKSDGTTAGTVGGGCLEAEVWQEAKNCMADGKTRLLTFGLTEKEAGDLGLICGGKVKILTEPIYPGIMDDLFKEVVRARSEGERVALATIISQGGGRPLNGRAKVLIRDGEGTIGSLGGELDKIAADLAKRVFTQEKMLVEDLSLSGDEMSRLGLVEKDGVWLFVEPITPQPTIFIFGGGHVALPIAKVAKMAGFKVVVIDDRPAFANFERFPEADEVIAEDFVKAFEKLDIDENSYIVSVTRGHQYDEMIIEQAVKTSARYIGLMGSKRRVRITFDRIASRGTPKELLGRVHAPIGLEIEADTPEEIAVSILAEIIKVRRERARRSGSRKALPAEKAQKALAAE
jgi:xanthine dehydrogenase accessory factor